MKKRWKLSRGKRTIINLVLSALLLVLTWGLMGYPLPTAELEFRRMERTHLLPRSEIVLSNGTRSGEGLQVSREDGAVLALDGTELYLRGRWMAGVLEDQEIGRAHV